MKLALIQLDIAFGNPEKNKQNAQTLIERAIEQSPDTVILPELWTTGYDLTRLNAIADPNAADIRAFAGDLAKKYQINIIAGSVAKQKGDKVTNTMTVFNRKGECIKEYSKVHLFRLMREERYMEAGEADGLFSIDDVSAAGFICYDIRFPEWLRRHVLQGAKLLFIPAEWPAPRLDHWRTLLTCRAIENQAFVIACNRAGSDPENQFAGHSLVISPWGEILAEAGDKEEILFADIDIASIDAIRNRIPVFEDRRPELY